MSDMDILHNPPNFDDWQSLLALLQETYAYMEGRIDPPSSLNQMDLDSLISKSRNEEMILAVEAGELVGCLFATKKGGAFYLAKIAVSKSRRGQGIARAMFDKAESLARHWNLKALVLQTRIELIENHLAFAAIGFAKTMESAHPGYDRATSITMEKSLA